MTKEERLTDLRRKINPDKILKGHRFKAHSKASEVCSMMEDATRLDWYIEYYKELLSLQI
jgi:predicted component of type VI protein secretion system